MGSKQVIVGKISGRGNVTIPKPIRDYLDLEKGDHVIFRFSEQGNVILEKAIISSPSQKRQKSQKDEPQDNL